MERHWQGLDFLRGLGIFILLVMHSAFYYFDGLWDLDLENPPVIISVIGFLLMFAGLFGMITGAVHGISILRLRRTHHWSLAAILQKKAVSAAFILAVAWLYFVLTGPGLADFTNRRMNNSILVDWILNSRWAGFDLERFFYIDSLVMIGSNLLLVSLIWLGLLRIKQLRPGLLLLSAGLVMALSLFRLTLYPWYLIQFENSNWPAVILTFWLINKNNPVLPFLAFGLMGSWLGLRLEERRPLQPVTWLGLALFATGMLLYVFLPDTMLQRAIDMKWYSIMLAQLGLFMLLIIGCIRLLDGKQHPFPVKNQETASATLSVPPLANSRIVRFFKRFSYAGLSAFFWESVIAALVWRLVHVFWPDLTLNIIGALLYGLLLALAWGMLLIAWERIAYVGSVEYCYGLVVKKLGRMSSKAGKLQNVNRPMPDEPGRS